MRLRYYSAAVTGLLSELMTIIAMWFWTRKDVIEMMVVAMLVYIIVFCVVLLATEEKKAKHKPIGRPPIVTLDPAEWYRK